MDTRNPLETDSKDIQDLNQLFLKAIQARRPDNTQEALETKTDTPNEIENAFGSLTDIEIRTLQNEFEQALSNVRPDERKPEIANTQSGTMTDLHLYLQKSEPDFSKVLALCENNPYVAAYNSKYQTPLLVAAQKEYFELIYFICDMDPDIINQHTIEQLCDILDTLLDKKQTNLIQFILNTNTDLRILCAFELLSNQSYSDMDLLKILLPETQPLSSDKYDNVTLLHMAIANLHEEAIKYFIDEKMLLSYSNSDLEELFLDLFSRRKIALARKLLEQRVEQAGEEKNPHPNSLIIFLKNYLKLPIQSEGNRMFSLIQKSITVDKLIELFTLNEPVTFRYSELEHLIDSTGSGNDLLKKIIHTFRLSEPLTGLMKAINETCIKNENGFYQLNNQVPTDLEIVIDREGYSIANKSGVQYKMN